MHVVRIQALNVQLNIVTWSSLVQSLMMHLHTDTFPVYGFKTVCVGKNTTSSPGFTLLHSAISLDLSEWGSSNFLPPAVFSYEHSSCSSGAGVTSLGVASLVFRQSIVRACASSTAHRRAQENLREREPPRDSWRAPPLYRPCEA